MNPHTRLLVVSLLLLLVGCGKEASDKKSLELAAPERQSAVFSDDPWLRDRLPGDTIAYARIPSPWRLAFGPAGKATDRMFATPEYVEAIASLREQLERDQLIGSTASAPMALLHKLASPLEIAVVAANRVASPAANVLVTARLAIDDTAALGAMIAGVTGSTPQFDAEGYAAIGAGLPAFMHFDATSRRLLLLSGTFANLESLKTLRTQIAAQTPKSRPALALEREIDANGQGLVVWLDVQAIRPIVSTMPGFEAPLTQALLQQVKTTALGWGSVAGQGRMSWRAEIAQPPWTQYLPQTERKFDVKTSGKPSMVITMALPTSTDLDRVRAQFEKDAGAEAAAKWTEAEQKLVELSGLKLVDWMAPFGSELISFTDQVGEFGAIRLRDHAALTHLRETLVNKLGAKYTSHAQGGTRIHHLHLPSFASLQDIPSTEPKGSAAAMVQELYQRLGTHLFWIEQDGWVVMAGVPQALIDRLNSGTDASVQDLLTASGVSPAALASFAGQSRDIARMSYYAYLSLALAASDAGNASFDIFKLPSAQALGLPRETAMGVSLLANAERFGVQASYAQSPIEFASGGNIMVTAAVAGVLAAIAIPAYQDYQTRATVANALSETAELKTLIAEHYSAEAQLPDTAAKLGIELPKATSDGKAQIDLDNGSVVVRFTEGTPQLSGKLLYLMPSQTSGQLNWRCGNSARSDSGLLLTVPEDLALTDIENRYLPTECR